MLKFTTCDNFTILLLTKKRIKIELVLRYSALV